MSGAPRRAALAATASVVVALALSGCGTDEGNLNGTMKGGRGTTASSSAAASPTASASATDHDQADLVFALTMLPHHLQAEEMAGLVETRSDDAQLRALATGIASAQHAQVEQLTSLLGAWGAAPDSALSDSEHLGGADGMMTDAQLSALGELSGEAFRTEWLRMMIAHHEGAVALASTELASGSNPQARDLATSILAAQQAEIEQMQGMLAG
jgi:uncharacterized protein (DUF305 family)